MNQKLLVLVLMSVTAVLAGIIVFGVIRQQRQVEAQTFYEAEVDEYDGFLEYILSNFEALNDYLNFYYSFVDSILYSEKASKEDLELVFSAFLEDEEFIELIDIEEGEYLELSIVANDPFLFFKESESVYAVDLPEGISQTNWRIWWSSWIGDFLNNLGKRDTNQIDKDSLEIIFKKQVKPYLSKEEQAIWEKVVNFINSSGDRSFKSVSACPCSSKELEIIKLTVSSDNLRPLVEAFNKSATTENILRKIKSEYREMLSSINHYWDDRYWEKRIHGLLDRDEASILNLGNKIGFGNLTSKQQKFYRASRAKISDWIKTWPEALQNEHNQAKNFQRNLRIKQDPVFVKKIKDVAQKFRNKQNLERVKGELAEELAKPELSIEEEFIELEQFKEKRAELHRTAAKEWGRSPKGKKYQSEYNQTSARKEYNRIKEHVRIGRNSLEDYIKFLKKNSERGKADSFVKFLNELKLKPVKEQLEPLEVFIIENNIPVSSNFKFFSPAAQLLKKGLPLVLATVCLEQLADILLAAPSTPTIQELNNQLINIIQQLKDAKTNIIISDDIKAKIPEALIAANNLQVALAPFLIPGVQSLSVAALVNQDLIPTQYRSNLTDPATISSSYQLFLRTLPPSLNLPTFPTLPRLPGR